jgi:hypothetical protein
MLKHSRNVVALSLVTLAAASFVLSDTADAAPKKTPPKPVPTATGTARPSPSASPTSARPVPAPTAAAPAPTVAAPAPAAGGLHVKGDCRNFDGSTPICDGTGESRVGKGEVFVVGSTAAEIGAGFVEGTTLYVASTSGVENQYEGCDHMCAISAIYKVDLLTGNRSIVSGYYQDPRSGVKVTGAGPYWGPATQVVRGTDGLLYAHVFGSDSGAARKIFRIAANGDRTEVWSSKTEVCSIPSGNIFNYDRGIAVGPGNLFYVVGNDSQSHAAVAKIDIASKKCTVFSVAGDKALGSGASAVSNFRGVSVQGSKLYTESYNETLMAVNIQNGAREVVTKSGGGGAFGSGDKIGVDWNLPAGGNVWTFGNQSRDPVKVNLESGDRESVDVFGAAVSAQLIPYGITNNVLVGGYQRSVYLVDLATGGSQVISR